MDDILDLIDNATGHLCACGCGHQLLPDGPSAYFATQECQRRWGDRQTTAPADVYDRPDADWGGWPGDPAPPASFVMDNSAGRFAPQPRGSRGASFTRPVSVSVRVRFADGEEMDYELPEGTSISVSAEMETEPELDPSCIFGSFRTYRPGLSRFRLTVEATGHGSNGALVTMARNGPEPTGVDPRPDLLAARLISP